jgi:hypothetical protein
VANASTTLPAPLEAVRRRFTTARVEAADCSFPELVWAHYLRQRELHDTGNMRGEADAEFRRRLAAFEAAEGRVLNAYWCTTKASAVALTEKRRGGLIGVFRRTPEIRLHAATDWIAADSPEIANTLHICETLGVRVTEVLSGTSERVAMQWILTVAGHLLGFIDREERPDRAQTKRLVARKRRELDKIGDYYHRAGEKVGRLVYLWGMLSGVALLVILGAAVGGLLWWLTDLNPHQERTQGLWVSYSMGALGSLMSVMTRMASNREGTFNLDYEVGRNSLRRLGSLRPCIGAIFALVTFCAIKGGIIQVLPNKQTIYVFAVVAFFAGFSERWANVLLGGTQRMFAGGEPEPQSETTNSKGAARA